MTFNVWNSYSKQLTIRIEWNSPTHACENWSLNKALFTIIVPQTQLRAGKWASERARALAHHRKSRYTLFSLQVFDTTFCHNLTTLFVSGGFVFVFVVFSSHFFRGLVAKAYSKHTSWADVCLCVHRIHMYKCIIQIRGWQQKEKLH